jgi:hypothetical protein
MACDCIKNFNKLLKEKFNETATVNCEMLSGRVIVNGIYHKPKFKGKLGEYQQKWEEVSLWPKYCPFCGKPYDIKEIYGPDTVELKENLYCTHVELNNWDYDEEDQMRPITYELSFRYYGVEVSAYISIIRLQKHEVDFSMVECDGDLMESFENIFRHSSELCENIFELCKKHWDEVEGKESEYEYDGTRHP